MDSEQRHEKRLEAMRDLTEDKNFQRAVSGERLGDKSLGDLVHEMLQIAVKKPELLDPDYKGEDKSVYQAYLDEINRREELYRTVPMQPDMKLYK